MKQFLRFALIALMASPLAAQESTELVLRHQPFEVHSAFWPNLHHVLLAEAVSRRASPEAMLAIPLPEPEGGLSPDERGAWELAVTYYQHELADLHPLFDMGEIRKALLSVDEELPTVGIAPAHRKALVEAAPVYRRHWWPAHDTANRAWANNVIPNVASLSPVVPERLSRLLGSPWFVKEVRMDVVPIASRQGAFTSIEPAPAHITISSHHPALTEWTAVEIVFHEASHALARPMLEAFTLESRSQGKNTRDLWHAALFYMTGEVVRQALADFGIMYEPYLYSTGLFERAWPRFKPLLETHWRSYVYDEQSRDDAIRQIVTGIE